MTEKSGNNVVSSPVGDLPSPEEAFEWPHQAGREKNWSEAAQRWAVLRKAYPEHAATWFHAANAHIKAEELEQAEVLLTHAQQQFPNHPNNLIDRATLAMCRQQWNTAEISLQQARFKTMLI